MLKNSLTLCGIMKLRLKRWTLKPLAFITLVTSSLLGQIPGDGIKTFDKDGLKFSYPANWTLINMSTDAVQDLRLSRQNSQVLISIVSPRGAIRSYDQFREMQSDINDRFIIDIKRSLNTEEETTREESVCLDFNGRNVTGMRYSGFYKSQPSKGDIFPFVLGDRFINLVYMRSGRDEALGDVIWKNVLGSLYLQNSHRDAVNFNFATDYMPAGDVRARAKYIGRPNLPYNIGSKTGLTAVVQVEVDEKGKVTSARSDAHLPPNISDPIKLELIKAAKLSKFEPTIVCGKPVKIRGFIVYKILPTTDPRVT
jgi:hypothetical protein